VAAVCCEAMGKPVRIKEETSSGARTTVVVEVLS
jgi:hypothetical protein